MASPNRSSPTPRHITSRTQRHTRPGVGTQTPEGSATTTITSIAPPADGLVLRLRGEHEAAASAVDPRQRRRIQWAEDVIDNEGLGRKKSKVCCIYHKTREVGESSSEDDSSSSSDSDSDASSGGDDGAARPVGGYKRGKGRGRRGAAGYGHKHKHEDGDGCDGHGHGGEKAKRKPSPNAYERMPKYDVKPLERQPGS